MWLQHRRSDPDSAAIVFQCIWCSFAALCFVQQAASPPFAWRQPFGSSGFTTPLAVPTITVFDPSMGPKYLPCSNCESKGPTRRLEGCTGIHHTRSPNCAKEGTARHPTFLSCAVLPSRPTENRRCMLVAKDTSHVNRSWSAGTSTPEADSTANLIDRTCLLTTFTELSAAPLDCGSQRTFLAPYHQSKPTSPPGVMQEWKAQCRTETPLCGIPKCPNL